jgi:hypothetical protein
MHDKRRSLWRVLTLIRRQGASRRALFLRDLMKNAEQLTKMQRWRAILAKAFQLFLGGRQLRLPPRLAPS